MYFFVFFMDKLAINGHRERNHFTSIGKKGTFAAWKQNIE